MAGTPQVNKGPPKTDQGSPDLRIAPWRSRPNCTHMAVGQKKRTQTGTLVNGNMDFPFTLPPTKQKASVQGYLEDQFPFHGTLCQVPC